MVSLGIRELDRVLRNYRSVELEADWFNHVDELVKIIRNASYNGVVHIVFYNSSKYCNVHDLYMEIEPYIEGLDNVSVFWESSIEGFVYHVLMLDRVKSGYLFLVIPYDRNRVSQVENTYLYKMIYLIEQAYSRGWNVIVVNPVVSEHRLSGVFIADVTARIKYYDGEALVKIINVRERRREALLFYSFK